MSDPIIPVETWNPAETYKRNDPRGWGGDPSRGAAMGRNDIKDIPEDYEAPGFTIHVEHILLIEGYDPNGTYFGSGGPLFWIRSEVEDVADQSLSGEESADDIDHHEMYLDYCERFVDLEDAVRIVQETWPHARVIGSEDWCDTLVEKYLDEEYERETQDDEEACADATLYAGTVVDSVDQMQVHEVLHECIIKPPSLDYDKWAALIERVRLAESVCERLVKIELSSGRGEYIATKDIWRLYVDASKVTGIALMHKFEETDCEHKNMEAPDVEETEE